MWFVAMYVPVVNVPMNRRVAMTRGYPMLSTPQEGVLLGRGIAIPGGCIEGGVS
jgi:hypothetical protein